MEMKKSNKKSPVESREAARGPRPKTGSATFQEHFTPPPHKSTQQEVEIARGWFEIELAEALARYEEHSDFATPEQAKRGAAYTASKLKQAKARAEELAKLIPWRESASKNGWRYGANSEGTLEFIRYYLATMDVETLPDEDGVRRTDHWLHLCDALRLSWREGPPFPVPSLMIELAKRLLKDWLACASWNSSVAFHLAETLSEVSSQFLADVQRKPEHFRKVAEHSLRWPVALNHRPEDKATLNEALQLFESLGLASKHPLRKITRWRGPFAKDVEFAWRWINTERSYLRSSKRETPEAALPPLTPATWKAWSEIGWRYFVAHYGKNWEDHPEVAKHFKASSREARHERRERIRDSYEGTWKTLAKQVTVSDSEKGAPEKREPENSGPHSP